MSLAFETDYAGEWRLTDENGEIDVPISLPGDVHTALLDAGKIPDPYFGNNELDVMWVSKRAWSVERTVFMPPELLHEQLALTISQVDCVATILLNEQVIAEVDNQFIRHDIDVTGKFVEGNNQLRIDFAVTRDVAKQRADNHPFPIPYAEMNQPHMAHINFVRKTACHGGWDWGICLMPIGVYGQIMLRHVPVCRLDSVQVDQHHDSDKVILTLKTRIHSVAQNNVTLSHKFNGQTVESTHELAPGQNTLESTLEVENPELWWPAGQGDQPLYDLVTEVGHQRMAQKIGLRKLEWVIEKDEIDHSFKCRVNDRDITMLGANWIPADAIPSRITPEVVRDLLESAVAANMNMIRVWGGGQYEPDYFYEMCDELGILIWHDFMFSCMPYPSDEIFLTSVKTEITQQVRRLQHHACIALWCGDNEVIGSLNWYPETRENRDRHVANYDRLSHALHAIVSAEDPTRRFWPSSPSLGYMDFADGWHIDTRGDMHFWDVWHSAKPFEHYRTVQPRFASEFGFQSFTSMNVIESFTNEQDRNPSSPVMEGHQRNDGGNARILETMCRYFRFPKDFASMVQLSQIQQGLAIKTAIEFWRSTKPRCMGTLYWQINDTWPVHSWASLDYGGQWKQLHYMARRFFRPLNVVAQPQGDHIRLIAINDGPQEQTISVKALAVNMEGVSRVVGEVSECIETAQATNLLDISPIADDEFLYFTWQDESGGVIGENDFFPRAYKYYDLPQVNVQTRWQGDDLVLSADKPAFFVTLSSKHAGYFSDNSITLFPGIDRRLSFTSRKGAFDPDHVRATLSVSHLRDTY